MKFQEENKLLHTEAQAGPSQVPPQVWQPLPILSNPSTSQPVQTDMSELINTQITGALSKEKKMEREEILKKKCSKYLRKICQMKNRLKHSTKNKDILKVLTEDMAVKKLQQKITPSLAFILQGQLRNCGKRKRGYRWTKEEKITCLRLFKRSPTTYRLLRRMFNLPSIGTLKSLLNKIPFHVGVNKAVFEVLKKHTDDQKPSENLYTLMFDEMSIKKHLEYNKKKDEIEGFQDHGIQGRSPLTAAYALVFMVAGVRKRVKQPIAHYFSSGFSTADRLVALIKEVSVLHLTEFYLVYTSC